MRLLFNEDCSKFEQEAHKESSTVEDKPTQMENEKLNNSRHKSNYFLITAHGHPGNAAIKLKRDLENARKLLKRLQTVVIYQSMSICIENVSTQN